MTSRAYRAIGVCLCVGALLLAYGGPGVAATKVKTKATEALPAEPSASASVAVRAADPAFAAFDDGRYLTKLALAKTAAAAGEPAANTLLGRMYAEGLGVGKDPQQAAEWYRKAADLGDANAQFALGLMLVRGQGVKQDRTAAADLFEKSAKAGIEAAKYNLGLLYISGDGRPADAKRAAALITEAAKGGDPQARYDLGQMFANGAGVPADDAQAAHWTELAAQAGLSDAQVEYGVMLFKGRGVAPDKSRAAWYFTAAAEHGNPIGQNRLANLYAYGVVYTKDLVTAAKWHLLARRAGVSDFKLDVFLAALTPEQRKQADKDAADWLERNNPAP